MKVDRHARRMAPRLSALRDGDLGALRAALLRRHLGRCAPCQGTLAALDAQVEALRALRDAPPAGEAEAGAGEAREDAGWLAIQQALRADPAEAPARRSWLRPGPVLAFGLATAAVLIVVAPRVPRLRALVERPPGDEVIVGLAEAEFRQAELHYQRAIEQLLRVSDRARASWSAREVRAHEARLSSLRAATERRRSMALSRPADADAQEDLYAAYRSQIAFLQDSLRRRPDAVRTVGFEGTTP